MDSQWAKTAKKRYKKCNKVNIDYVNASHVSILKAATVIRFFCHLAIYLFSKKSELFNIRYDTSVRLGMIIVFTNMKESDKNNIDFTLTCQQTYTLWR